MPNRLPRDTPLPVQLHSNTVNRESTINVIIDDPHVDLQFSHAPLHRDNEETLLTRGAGSGQICRKGRLGSNTNVHVNLDDFDSNAVDDVLSLMAVLIMMKHETRNQRD